MRITVQGQVAEIMIKRSIPVHLWNQAKERSNGKNHIDRELNHYLETVKARIYQIHRELEIDGKRITVNAIRDRYYGKEDSKTLGDVYREHNKKCRALIRIDFTESTVGEVRYFAFPFVGVYETQLWKGRYSTVGSQCAVYQ
jgi:hypothetical protein